MQNHCIRLLMEQFISTGQKDEQMQKLVDAERNRLIKKMNSEKRSGAPVSQHNPVTRSCIPAVIMIIVMVY